jgi:hypothetical protein
MCWISLSLIPKDINCFNHRDLSHQFSVRFILMLSPSTGLFPSFLPCVLDASPISFNIWSRVLLLLFEVLKLSLYEDVWGSECIGPRILDLVGGEWPVSRPDRFAPEPVRETRRIEKSYFYRDSNSDPSVVQPEASRYTDWTTPVPYYWVGAWSWQLTSS